MNVLAHNRSELQYSVKENCKFMSKPATTSWDKLVRVGRYLNMSPRVVHTFRYQQLPRSVTVSSDSEFGPGAGRRGHRRAEVVSGWGWHMVKIWSRRQSVVALSSGEAEYYALLKSASHGIEALSLFDVLCLRWDLQLETDSSAALGIIRRRDLGKTRHTQTCYVRLQPLWYEGKIRAKKVPRGVRSRLNDEPFDEGGDARVNVPVGVGGASREARLWG